MNKESAEKSMISSISINGRITLNLHALNNEGGEGNQLLTRQVTIIDNDGNPVSVNAVSGDMLKHIQAEHLYNITKEFKLDMCSSCSIFNANRITADPNFTGQFTSDTPSSEVLDLMLKTCAVDDLEGILITNNNKNVPRKSVAEFGWLVGIPEKNKSENYFHVKFDSGSRNAENEDAGANLGQIPFHRPANSGVYALVSNFDVCRIGYNDISKIYPIEDKVRMARYLAFLKSILYTFIKPLGAHRNTQNPHITSFSGVITYSKSSIPAPTISPLNPNYLEEIENIVNTLNCLQSESISMIKFSDMSEFAQEMAKIIQSSEPLKL